MNDIIEAFIHDHLFLHLVLIAVSMTAIIVAMGIDFISGIQKAKQRGELRTSKKYKMTATKAKKYFNPFLTLVMIDLICCIVIPFPVFAMLWAAYCVFCEFKSVREKSWEKAELRKAEKTMSIIIDKNRMCGIGQDCLLPLLFYLKLDSRLLFLSWLPVRYCLYPVLSYLRQPVRS